MKSRFHPTAAALGTLGALAIAACEPAPSWDGVGTVSARLTGSGLSGEVESLRIVAFDLTDQGCTGHRVANPALAPLATSGLVSADEPSAVLSVPAGARTLYAEVYDDADGVSLFGTGCREAVFAAGQHASVTIPIERAGAADGDADADGDGDADADGDSDVEEDGDAPDVPDAEDGGGTDAEDGAGEADGDSADADGDASEDATGDDGDATEADVPPLPALVVSEIDYDQTGEDNAEFVEIYNAGDTAVSCADVDLRLVNGVGSTTYRTHALSCATLPAGQFHVLGSTLLLGPLACPSSQVLGSGGTDLIQNGPSTTGDPGDAVALVHRPSGAILDQVAYEAVVAGWGEGTPAPVEDATAESLQRNPAGRDTGDNAADFSVRAPTPCTGP